jgi:hypothetical protein
MPRGAAAAAAASGRSRLPRRRLPHFRDLRRNEHCRHRSPARARADPPAGNPLPASVLALALSAQPSALPPNPSPALFTGPLPRPCNLPGCLQRGPPALPLHFWAAAPWPPPTHPSSRAARAARRARRPQRLPPPRARPRRVTLHSGAPHLCQQAAHGAAPPRAPPSRWGGAMTFRQRARAVPLPAAPAPPHNPRTPCDPFPQTPVKPSYGLKRLFACGRRPPRPLRHPPRARRLRAAPPQQGARPPVPFSPCCSVPPGWPNPIREL